MLRHFNVAIVTGLAIIAFPLLTHAQTCEPIALDVGKAIAVQPPDAAGIRVVAPTAADNKALSGAVPVGGQWTVTQPQLDILSDVVSRHADQRRAVRLGTSNAAGAPTVAPPILFLLPGESKEMVCGTGASANRLDPKMTAPAASDQCLRAAVSWTLGNGRYRVPVLFNSKGVHCYSPPVIGHGDLLVVGMVLVENELPPADVVSVEFTNCPQESSAPQTLANGSFKDIQFQSVTATTRLEVRYLDARSCGSESPVVSVKIGAGDKAVSTPYTLSQFKRYHAALHLGAVYTDLREPDFALRDQAGSNVIFDKEAHKRGPEYVATLVIQGIAHYFDRQPKRLNDGLTDTNNWIYKGRDPIHEGAWKDRLGVVISAGLEDPGDRFGVGLSYEIATGLNVIALYEMARIKQLDGFAIGDTFTGTVDALPTRKEWESKVSLGLTFDIAYITKLFSGAAN